MFSFAGYFLIFQLSLDLGLTVQAIGLGRFVRQGSGSPGQLVHDWRYPFGGFSINASHLWSCNGFYPCRRRNPSNLQAHCKLKESLPGSTIVGSGKPETSNLFCGTCWICPWIAGHIAVFNLLKWSLSKILGIFFHRGVTWPVFEHGISGQKTGGL